MRVEDKNIIFLGGNKRIPVLYTSDNTYCDLAFFDTLEDVSFNYKKEGSLVSVSAKSGNSIACDYIRLDNEWFRTRYISPTEFLKYKRDIKINSLL